MTGNVWVMAEHWKGEVTDATYELLALGRELADGLGVPLEAVLLGSGASGLAGTLGTADTVLYVDDPSLEDASGEQASRALQALAAGRDPGLVLLPITNVGWDLIGLLPASLEGALVNFCSGAAVVDGAVEAQCLLYGGKMNVTARPAGSPAILAVLPGTRPADAGRAGAAPVEEIALELPEPRVRLRGYVEPEAGDVDITQQEVLIGVGRGIDSDANLEVAQELADALGGAVCGSRPVIDQGWLTLDRQVGKSGVTVKPRFYVAAGISGAPEHTEGMKDAELIVAINTDPDAPIFSVAHFGVVEDCTDVLEALVAAIEEKRG